MEDILRSLTHRDRRIHRRHWSVFTVLVGGTLTQAFSLDHVTKQQVHRQSTKMRMGSQRNGLVWLLACIVGDEAVEEKGQLHLGNSNTDHHCGIEIIRWVSEFLSRHVSPTFPFACPIDLSIWQ
jgi:hypothetical protein